MEEFLPKLRKLLSIDHLVLLFIVFVGAILRFYDYSNLPYSYDEFSALFRTRFDNFNDLIRFGVVATDTHPAGVQVFMYYWVKLFGESEMMVKLPFMLAGLLAIIAAYKIGTLWFNKTVGLFAALFLSVLQYPILYSQYARPYASGLFLSLLMVWFWTNVVFYPEKKRLLNQAGFILAAALCAYNHHFSMFLAVLVGASGLFFLKGKRLFEYLLICLAVILLYLPHLNILILQINKGGVEEWLSKPKPGFIIDYFGYTLHFSKLLIGLTTILILTGFVLYSKQYRKTNKFRLLAFTWFSITYMTGYFYSVYVNAVLQYSVLIFVFPFLVMFVFSFYRDVQGWVKIVVAVLFITVSVYTLIYDRRHYEIAYQSGYEQIPIEADKINHQYPEKAVTTIIFEPPKIREYYMAKYQINDSHYFYPDSTVNFVRFRDFINQQTSDFLVLGWINNKSFEYKLIVEEKYPYLIGKKDWFKSNLYLYSRTKPGDTGYVFDDPILFNSLNTFDNLTYGWENVMFYYQLANGVSYPNDKFLILNKEFGFSPKFKANLKEIINSQTNEVCISVDTYMPTELANPSIICELRLNGERIGWRAGNIIEFTNTPKERSKAYLVVRLIDGDFDDPATEIWIYLWNKNLEEILIDNFLIEVREGNPLFYALFRKI
jgi:hypothetical protein